MTGILSDLLFLIGLIFFVFFFYSLSKQRNRFAALFSIMCLTVAIYVIGYGFELRAQTVDEIKFFLKMEYFGSPFMTAFWLLFAYKFRFNRTPSLKIHILVFLIPLLTLFFSVTNEYHHLLYTSVSAVQYDGFIIARLVKGPWYYVYVTYSYGVLLLGIAVFYLAWRQTQYKTKTQAFWMLFGSIWPGLFDLIYLFGFSPYGLDIAPFAFSILAACYFNALFRYDFLDLKDIIRSVTFSEINEGIIVIDDRYRLIDFNRAAREFFSWLEDKNIGLELSSFPEGKTILEQKNNLFEIEIKTGNIRRYCEFRVTPLREGKVLGYTYFVRDISEQKKMMQELNRMASYDPLTQVYNRRRLLEEAEKELLRAKRHYRCFSVLMMDLDHFKNVNDQYGHLAGDEVIRSVIQSCREIIRATDIIGRYGGEEFIIVLSETGWENACQIAECIRELIAGLEVPFHGEIIRITVSIGVVAVLGSNDKISIRDIINKADQALYQAKNNGRNQVVGLR